MTKRNRRKQRFTPVPTTGKTQPRTPRRGRLKLVADKGKNVLPRAKGWPADYDRLSYDPDEVVPPAERAQIVRSIVGDDEAAYFDEMRRWQEDGWRRGDGPF